MSRTDTLGRPTGTAAASAGRESGARRIDPRIRARRIDVRRDEGRRRLWKIGLLLGLVALVGGAVAALRSPLLDVDHVVVVGATRTGAAKVVAASGVHHEVPLASVSLPTASRRIAALPWVFSATVRRNWPGTVRIIVTERRPVVQVPSFGGGWLLVDRSGRLLERRLVPEPGIIILTGVEAEVPGVWLGTAWLGVLRVSVALPTDLRPQVVSVGHDQRGAGLRLANATTVVLGGSEQLDLKFVALRTLLAQPNHRCFASINLRVASAPALTHRPGCA